MKTNKVLVELLEKLTHKQIFFVIWFGIVSLFTYLIWSFYKKRNERNFREDSFKPLPKPSSSNALTVSGKEKTKQGLIRKND